MRIFIALFPLLHYDKFRNYICTCLIEGGAMYTDLHENRDHGTKECPYVFYHITGIKHSFQTPVHWHHEIEIIYIRSGNLKLSIAGASYLGNEHSIFIVNSGELHLMQTKDGFIDYYTFLFPPEFISFQTNDYLETAYLLPLRNGQFVFKNDFTGELKEKQMDICEKLSAKPFDSDKHQLQIRILLLEFLQNMIDNDMLGYVPSQKNELDKEIISYIQQNYCNEISLSNLSACFHLSEKYLSRYFKEHFQISFTQYVKHLRLSHAEQLLIASDMSVTEISYQCGFQNISHFIRTFSKAYHISPLQYRKLYQQPYEKPHEAN